MKSDVPRIWSDRGVLPLALILDVRVNQMECDVVIEADFRTMLQLAWGILEIAVSAVISALNQCSCCFRSSTLKPPEASKIRKSECVGAVFSKNVKLRSENTPKTCGHANHFVFKAKVECNGHLLGL